MEALYIRALGENQNEVKAEERIILEQIDVPRGRGQRTALQQR
jgi:hypothetical protein